MDCVDASVAALPTRSKKAFEKHARAAVQMLKEAGATRVVAF